MSTDLATQKPGRRATLQAYLSDKNVLNQLAMALPRHITPEKMARVALTATVRNPTLLDCTPESVCLALLEASQLGLEPNGRDAHLVPFRDNKNGVMRCTLIPDYKGLVQLAYRSGVIDNFTAMAVHEGDEFAYEFGSNERLRHVPSEDENPGPLTHAWAMVRFKDGASKFVVLNKRQITKRQRSSKTKNSANSFWDLHPEEMWAKSAAKALAKWIPQTPEMARFHAAVDKDNEVEYGEPLRLDISGSTKTASINAALEAVTMPAIQGEVMAPESPPTINDPDSQYVSRDRREEYMTQIADLTAIGGVEVWQGKAQADALLDDADRDTVLAACERRKLDIRGNRGAKSNGGKMFDAAESATEAGY